MIAQARRAVFQLWLERPFGSSALGLSESAAVITAMSHTVIRGADQRAFPIAGGASVNVDLVRCSIDKGLETEGLSIK